MQIRLVVSLAVMGLVSAGCHLAPPVRSSRPNAPSPSGLLSTAQATPLGKASGFVDVTQSAGLQFIQSVGENNLTNLVESTGSGCAFLDYDNDGFLDIYLTTGVPKPPFTRGPAPPFRPRNRLYHNRGDATFEEVTDRAGVGLERYTLAVAVGDYDNDHLPDIFVACYQGPNALFHNNGNGTFTDVAAQAGVADMACSDGAAFFDYDNDGWLDLYVCNYIQFDPNYQYFYNPDGFPGPLSYEGEADILYRNRGNGTFENVTHKVGVYSPAGRGMGVVAADYDNDGDMDIYVVNDAMGKELFRNEGGGRFTEVATEAGVAFNMAGEGTGSMMASCADYDNDGDLDIFVSDNTFKSLFRNEGYGLFQDVSAQVGVASASGQYVSWGSGWLDYDNDGNLDLFIINGALHHLYGQESVLLKNDGTGRFQDVSTRSGEFFRRKICGRGAAFGDFDNDGRVDVLIVVLNSPAILLRNLTSEGRDNHWLTLKLVGRKSNRDGVGTKIKLVYDGKTRIAQKEGGGAYLSANDPRLHFGLGRCKQVQRIEITWPSGIRQTLTDVAADRILTVEEPQA